MSDTFTEFALVLGLVSALGYVVHRLRLPLMVAYLSAGVALSLIFQLRDGQFGIFNFLPDLGIAFVLFLIGMELDLRELRALGKPIVVSSLLQVAISAVAGFTIASFFGFSETESLLLGLGLSFSSTVVIVKMLLEKKELSSLYGKLSVGILLIEDLVAIAVLMAISVAASGSSPGFTGALPFVALGAKALALFLLTFLLSKYVLVKIFGAVAKSAELLFLTAITWCFLFTALAQFSGFSVTIGAFLAGVSLAASPYHFQIQGKIKPLRDFFITLFFVYLGTQVGLGDMVSFWPIVLVFTLFALVAKPLIFLLVLGAFGFRKHTIFQTAVNLSQVSEFSLIIMLLAVKLGMAPAWALSIMASVAVLSVMGSSVLIAGARGLYGYLAGFLGFFERQHSSHALEVKNIQQISGHVVVIGAHRVGGPIVQYLKSSDIPFLVMDFNPHVVESLGKKGVNVIYGDIGDPDVLDYLRLETAKLIISTATDENDNELLLLECRRRHVRALVVVRAMDDNHAEVLKSLGAEYVILPEKVSGDFLASQLKLHWPQIRFSGLS